MIAAKVVAELELALSPPVEERGSDQSLLAEDDGEYIAVARMQSGAPHHAVKELSGLALGIGAPGKEPSDQRVRDAGVHSRKVVWSEVPKLQPTSLEGEGQPRPDVDCDLRPSC